MSDKERLAKIATIIERAEQERPGAPLNAAETLGIYLLTQNRAGSSSGADA